MASKVRAVLSLSLIVETAIAVADEGGLEAVTMRGVGQRLNATGMALYRHVANREALIELMIDQVVEEFAYPADRPGHWREALRATARQDWRSYLAHPWMPAATATAKPPMGPNMLAAMEWSLAIFDGFGLSAAEKLYLLGVVNSYGQGLALSWVHGLPSRGEDREGAAEWWLANLPGEGDAGTGPRYPRLLEVTRSLGMSPASESYTEDEFEFGLQRVLDGIEVYLDRRG
ncbi:AcrR family transcriptional regulator [Saccharothrix tamanrassetensis]|uniref:AcrR family transcriptional regulator n=1 Tax=Saccharothrix tamanrassetensis TaxID=1051531 RepID=A0A841CM05_9PSEU|nr:TetR/AcrR family transcriptional regulator [Saccharothrix tamanrassetensis]MBB5959502.1 AcrR family transcriptional regulator [Saccharothrix tamanrassetensis]